MKTRSRDRAFCKDSYHMTRIFMRTFSSFRDLVVKGASVFRGPSFLMTFLRVDPTFREKILLAVTVANNCYG